MEQNNLLLMLIWLCGGISAYMALYGSPFYRAVAQMSLEETIELDINSTEGNQIEDPRISSLAATAVLRILAELLVVGLELVVAIYLLFGYGLLLAGFVLLKAQALILLGGFFIGRWQKNHDGAGFFTFVRSCPGWMRGIERISAFISASCFFFIFYLFYSGQVNG